MIDIKNLSYRLGEQTILNDISLQLQTGQVVALIGPNGAGKSTLFSLMARITPLQTGAVVFGEHDITRTDNRTLAQTLAMLTQENHVQGRLRVRELLMFGRYPYHQGRPTATDEEKVAWVLEKFELTALSERFLSDLSGGQRQRVLIAMVVCQDTPYVLLDEPLNNLDMYHAGKLMRQLRQLCHTHKKTVVIVLHDVNQAAQFADTVVMMKLGEIISTGTPTDVLTKDTIKTLYGVEATVLYHQGRPVIVDVGDETLN